MREDARLRELLAEQASDAGSLDEVLLSAALFEALRPFEAALNARCAADLIEAIVWQWLEQHGGAGQS